jgi:hypothetical protein
MAKIMVSIIGLIFSAQAWATNLDPAPFFKRFEQMKDAKGNVSMIVLRRGEVQFSVSAIVEEIRKDLEFAQRNQLAAYPQFESVAREMTAGGDFSDMTPEQKELAQRSYDQLMKLNIPATFDNPKFKDVMKRFENKVKQQLIGHRVMANLQDPKYFYTRAVTYKLASFGFDLVRKYLDNVPVINIATMVIDRAVASIQERRLFHQNMLLFYLERFPANQLQMSAEEVDFVKSSIYESRIPWFLYPESQKARQTWRWYGSDYFGYYRQQSDITLEKNLTRYESIGERICFSFQIVTEKGQMKVINLVDSKFIMSPLPADSYFFNDPKKVERQRRLLRLAQLGLQFVPVPSFVKNVFNTFLNSMYVNQEKTEGALFGYFESAGQTVQAATVVRQTLNPFLRSDFELNPTPDVWVGWN